MCKGLLSRTIISSTLLLESGKSVNLTRILFQGSPIRLDLTRCWTENAEGWNWKDAFRLIRFYRPCVLGPCGCRQRACLTVWISLLYERFHCAFGSFDWRAGILLGLRSNHFGYQRRITKFILYVRRTTCHLVSGGPLVASKFSNSNHHFRL